MNLEHFRPDLTRRAFLRCIPPAAAALLASGQRAGAAGAVEAFSFYQINDLHFLEDTCAPWFRSVVEQMKASSPGAKLCLLCGDVADKGDEAALRSVQEIFSGLGVPLLPVPGNHDFTPEESRAGYDAVFPGRLNYVTRHGGWQFIGLDSTMGTKYDKTTISAETLKWLDDEVARLDSKAPTVAFTHFPLGEGVTYRPLNAADLVERLLRLNLVAVFSGHWHGASEKGKNGAVLTTNRCCARVRNNADRSPQKGWFVCEARTDGTLTRRFVEFRAPAGVITTDVAAPQPAKR